MTGRHFGVKKMDNVYCKGIVRNMCCSMFPLSIVENASNICDRN